MKPGSRTLYVAVALGLLALPQASANAGLWELARQAREDVSVAADALQRHQARTLARDLVRSAPTGALPADAEARARALGLRLRPLNGAANIVVLVPETRGSSGILAVRLGPAVPVLLQAPHAWYDRKTGPLVAQLFEAGIGRAAMLNTAHRYGGSGDAPDGSEDPGRGSEQSRKDPSFDVAHRADTLFQALTLGAIQGMERPVLIQFHGYGDGTSDAVAVVSAGATPQPAAEVARLRRDLSRVLGGEVLTGAEVPALAATTNVQSRALPLGTRFLHIELSARARDGLTGDAKQRAELARVLVRAAAPAEALP